MSGMDPLSLAVEISGNAARTMEYASKHISGWVFSALGDKTAEFIPFVQDGYLHGQAMRWVTGKTAGSVKMWSGRKRKKEDAWYVRPGVGIRGSLNYLYRWIGTPHEFMAPGFERFVAMARIPDYIGGKVKERFDGLE